MAETSSSSNPPDSSATAEQTSTLSAEKIPLYQKLATGLNGILIETILVFFFACLINILPIAEDLTFKERIFQISLAIALTVALISGIRGRIRCFAIPKEANPTAPLELKASLFFIVIAYFLKLSHFFFPATVAFWIDPISRYAVFISYIILFFALKPLGTYLKNPNLLLRLNQLLILSFLTLFFSFFALMQPSQTILNLIKVAQITLLLLLPFALYSGKRTFSFHLGTIEEHKGFDGLLITQFLGALNDNVLKQFMLLSVASNAMWGVYTWGRGAVTLLFALPFIVGSATAGQHSDKSSKQRIAVQMKSLEIIIALVAGISIYFGSFWGTLFSFFLLSSQSTVFGPAKYGMIPELVPAEKISSSNGLISMTTNISAITGTVVAGLICVKNHQSNPANTLFVLLYIAILGRIAVTWITPLTAKAPDLEYSPPLKQFFSILCLPLPWRLWSLFKPHVETFREMRLQPYMVTCSISWGFFYFLGTTVLQTVSDFGTPLNIKPEKVSFLMVFVGIAIGTGSLLAGLAGKLQGGISFLSLRIGGYGMILSFLTFFFIPHTFKVSAIILVSLGIFAGLFVVPIMSFIQAKSPMEKRGRYMGANNLLSFVMVALAGVYELILNSIPYTKAPHTKLGICSIFVFVAMLFIRKIR